MTAARAVPAAGAAAQPLPLGLLVRERAGWPSEPPLLTFVGHDASGGYEVSHRHYASLWQRGQALARALAARGVAAGAGRGSFGADP